MVMLHQPLAGRDIPLIDKYEKCSFAEVRNLIRAEFVPPVIGASEKDFYRFPIRTALTSCTDQKQDFELFSNMNIAFSYEKARIPAWHKVDTDLKWKKNNGLKIRLFIRELLYMLRTQMIMDNADPSMCNVIWFRPLSFINSHQMIFNNIWKQETKDILHLSGGSLTDQTESDAPYYYYQKAGLIKDISSVAVVDIGGGSTDYVVFRNNKPEISASVNFG